MERAMARSLAWFALAANLTNTPGELDLVSANGGGVSPGIGLSTFRGKGDGTFPTEVDMPSSSAGTNGFAIADFDRNGALDVATPSLCTLYVFLNHCR
jgi:hypothetical protein